MFKQLVDRPLELLQQECAVFQGSSFLMFLALVHVVAIQARFYQEQQLKCTKSHLVAANARISLDTYKYYYSIRTDSPTSRPNPR